MNTDDLSRWATRAALDLRSYAEAAAEAGNPQPHTEHLLAELEDIRAGRPIWIHRVAERCSESSVLDAL